MASFKQSILYFTRLLKQPATRRHQRLRPTRTEGLESRLLLTAITNATQLIGMSLNGNHTLENDIDLTGLTYTPVGTASSPFTGSLDGNGHTISGLRINTSTQYVGLFGYANGAEISDLTLEDADIDATFTSSDYSYLHIGGIAGKAVNTDISNVNVSGEIDGSSYGGVYAGGLVGYGTSTVDSSITDSRTSASVFAQSDSDWDSYGGYGGYVGGVIGLSNDVDVHRTSADGDVDAYGGDAQYAGGIIGAAFTSASSGTKSTDVTDSQARGDVEATVLSYSTYDNAYAGGLIGYSSVSGYSSGNAGSVIDQNHATGNASSYTTYGKSYSGGLIGYASVNEYTTSIATFDVTDSYAWGDADTYSVVPNSEFAGGFVGQTTTATGTSAIYARNYAIGTPDPLADFSGGLIGSSDNNALFSSNFWDTQTSGTIDGVDNIDPDPVGVTGKLTSQMKNQSTFSGWDFTNDWVMVGYPHLRNEFDLLEDDGGALGITNIFELQMVSFDLTGDYYLANDFDASAINFTPLGTASSAFTGSLDGRGHTVTGLRVNSGLQEVGLFGQTNGASIDDLELSGIDIDGFFSGPDWEFLHIGGVVGRAVNTEISNVDVDGDLDGSAYGGVYAGGLVGYGSSTADNSITDARSSVSVSARSDADWSSYGGYGGFAGGIIGRSDDVDVHASSAVGDVEAIGGDTQYAGGLIGYAYTGTGSGTKSQDVTDSRATGDATATVTNPGYYYNASAYAGGLIGYTQVASWSSGNAASVVDQSHATGDASSNASAGYGGSYSGGLIGYAGVSEVGSSHADLDVRDSYAEGNADTSSNTTSYAGGLVGQSFGTGADPDYTRTYAIGIPDAGSTFDGGLIGHSTNALFFNNFWDTGTSGTTDGVGNLSPDPSGVTGQTSVQMHTESTFTAAGWNFAIDWIMAGRPHLQNEFDFLEEVDGRLGIANVVELQLMSLGLDRDFVLLNDIDAGLTSMWNVGSDGPQGFVPIGNDPDSVAADDLTLTLEFDGTEFSGSLDGDDNTISNLFIDRQDQDFIGLFGNIVDTGLTAANASSRSASVFDLTIDEPRITGRRFVGALAGLSETKVANVDVTTTDSSEGANTAFVKGGGDVTDDTQTDRYVAFNVGGLIGKSSDQGTSVIEDSTVDILVTFATKPSPLNAMIALEADVLNMGGLAGQTNEFAVVTNSSAHGDVIANTLFRSWNFETESENFNNHIGGFVGENDGFAQGTIVGGVQQWVEASGKVTGARNVGGLIGEHDGILQFGRAVGIEDVDGLKAVGGLIGKIEGASHDEPGIVRDSAADHRTVNAVVGATDEFGGFVGAMEGGLVQRSFADVDVVAGLAKQVGGFVGQTKVLGMGGEDHGEGAGVSVIIDSFSVGNAVGDDDVGGFVGQHEGFIRRSYATGNATAMDDRAGGFVGDQQGGTITDSFSTGVAAISGTSVGGFAGRVAIGSVNTNNWWANVTNMADTGFGSGDEITAAASVASFHNSGHDVFTRAGFAWDYVSTWVDENNGLPTLIWQS